MKKINIIAAVLLTALMVLFASGCASAYDVAVKNGYSGTETQWLESLKGKDGADGKDITIEQVYTYARQNGFEGTYLDFLDEYLSFEVGQSNEAAVSKGIRSAVEVYCAFNQTSYFGQNGVTQGGAGIIYKLNSETGSAYIITNYHVVYSDKSNSENISSDIKIIPYGGEPISAQYVGGTPTYDIAVLKVSGLKTDNFMTDVTVNTSDVNVGQTAIAIGNPSGAGISVTQGIVSVDSENITMNAIDNPRSQVTMRVIRIDAAVNSGNSGGGLFNDRGEFIGVVNAKAGDNDIENVGYAIPASIAVSVADHIIRNGTFSRGLAGITIRSDDVHAYLDQDGYAHIAEKVVVDSVSGASSGILQKGDVIKSVKVFDREITVTRSFNITDALLAATNGDEVTFTVERDGKETVATVILQSQN